MTLQPCNINTTQPTLLITRSVLSGEKLSNALKNFYATEILLTVFSPEKTR